MKTLRTVLLGGCAACVLFASAVCAQVKQHDYTAENKTLDRKEFAPKDSTLGQKRSGLTEKSFSAKEYRNTKDASALIEKSFYISEDKKSPFSAEAKFRESSKNFESKDFTPKKKEWFDSDKKQNRWDTEKDLSKTYRGKLDFSKASPFSTDNPKDAFDGMRELSMQDINRYQFRRSHPLDPGLKQVRAGGKLNDVSVDSSFWGTSRKPLEIATPPPSFFGKVKNAKEQRGGDSSKNTAVADSDKLQQAAQRQRKSVKAVEYLDESKSQKYEFLRVPEGMKAKGKAVIKVETDE